MGNDQTEADAESYQATKFEAANESNRTPATQVSGARASSSGASSATKAWIVKRELPALTSPQTYTTVRLQPSDQLTSRLVTLDDDFERFGKFVAAELRKVPEWKLKSVKRRITCALFDDEDDDIPPPRRARTQLPAGSQNNSYAAGESDVAVEYEVAQVDYE